MSGGEADRQKNRGCEVRLGLCLTVLTPVAIWFLLPRPTPRFGEVAPFDTQLLPRPQEIVIGIIAAFAALTVAVQLRRRSCDRSCAIAWILFTAVATYSILALWAISLPARDANIGGGLMVVFGFVIVPVLLLVALVILWSSGRNQPRSLPSGPRA